MISYSILMGLNSIKIPPQLHLYIVYDILTFHIDYVVAVHPASSSKIVVNIVRIISKT